MLPHDGLSDSGVNRVPPRAGQAALLIAPRDMTDSDRVAELFHRCERALEQGIRRVVIDLKSVETADTKLLACIVAIYQMARSAMVRLELSLSNAVREVA